MKNPIIYGSVCSGIEAATAAWHGLGWQPSFFSEIERFPRAVLQHHYPEVPLHGDFTTIKESDYAAIDLLVGGTPCQAFSVAGLRKGFADDRGNLTLEFVRLAQRLQPRWLVWENVPGVLSIDGGRAFSSFLGGLAELGYGFAYRVLDAQYFGVPQRRRRVFVVAYLGDWRPAAAVLFERESLRGDITPRREAGQTAPTIPSRSTAGGGLGTDFDCDGGLIASKKQWPADVNRNLAAHYGDKMGLENQHVFNQNCSRFVPAIPFDTTQITSAANYSNPKPGDACHPLAAGAHAPAIAIQGAATRESSSSGPDGIGVRTDDTAYTLEARAEVQAVAFDLRGREGGAQFEGPHDTANIRAASGGSSRSYVASMQVRRLTPRECERLQGFPDDYTLLPGRAADGPRYKALGNSMAVPVMRWLGERIQAVEALL